MTTIQEPKLEEMIEGILIDIKEPPYIITSAPLKGTSYRYKADDGTQKDIFVNTITGVSQSGAKKGDKIEIYKFSDGGVRIDIRGGFFSSLKHRYSGAA